MAEGTRHRADFGVSTQSNEGRREKPKTAMVSAINNVLTTLAVAIKSKQASKAERQGRQVLL